MDVVKRPKNIRVDVSPAGPNIRVTMTDTNGYKGEDFYQIRYCHRTREDNVRCGLSSNQVTIK